MRIRAQVANFLSGGEIVRTRRESIAAKQQVRRLRIRARYEASLWNQNRSYLPGFIQSAREDINALSRLEILRRVRYFEKNSSVLLKVLSILDTNVIGAGITPSPATSSMDWNKAALKWWNEWSTVADISGESDIPGLQSIGYMGQCVDGDHFVRCMFNDAGRPALEMIEAHRCGTNSVDTRILESKGFKIVDGVIVGVNKRAAAFLIADDFDASNVTPIPASNVVQLWRKKRAGQYRGITLFHAAILDLHDLDDLQKYEMRAAKDAASISKIVETAAGATTTDGNGIGASLQASPTVDVNGKATYYHKAAGSETILTQPGDKWQQFKSDRPSAATSGFWDKLDNKIVQGAGVSYAALVDYKGNWGGATLRAAVQSDNRLYSLETGRQANKWQKIWEFGIGWAMASGELEKNPDFRNTRWHPPRRTSVDIGNDSNAMIEELKGGLRTFEDIYGEIGEDWKDRLDQRAQEESFIEVLAKKYNIPRQLISSFAMERLAGQAPDALAPDGTSPATGQPPTTTEGGKKK